MTGPLRSVVPPYVLVVTVVPVAVDTVALVPVVADTVVKLVVVDVVVEIGHESHMTGQSRRSVAPAAELSQSYAT